MQDFCSYVVNHHLDIIVCMSKDVLSIQDPSTAKYSLTVYPRHLATSYSKSNVVFLHIDPNSVPCIQDSTVTHALLLGHSARSMQSRQSR